MRTFDHSTLRSQQWDSEILGLVAQIHEYKGLQELYLRQKPAVLDKLIDIAQVQSAEASNKIEGIVTTSTRVQQLCTEKTTPRNRDEEEIMELVPSISKTSVENSLKKLIEEGTIQRHGKGKSTFYVRTDK